MNLKQQLPDFHVLRDIGISCDGNKVTMAVIKVRIFIFNFFLTSKYELFPFLKEK